MKNILEEIKHCRSRNLVLFKELREKLGVPQDGFIMDIDYEDDVTIKEESTDKKALYVDGKEQKDKVIVNVIKKDGVDYIAVKRLNSDGKDYDLVIVDSLKD